jgi:hypothetical protein
MVWDSGYVSRAPEEPNTANWQQQEPSKDSIILTDKNSGAIDVLLEYLYTLSDRVGPEWVDEIDFAKTPDIYNILPSDCEHLIFPSLSQHRGTE